MGTESQTNQGGIDPSVLDELKSNPNGNISGVSREDLELVAMLAGTTSMEMRKSQFIDNIASNAASTPVVPKTVLQELIKTVPVANVRPPQPRPAAQVAGAVQPLSQPQKIDDNQFELPFRQSTIEDIVSGLDSVTSRLVEIERKIKIISNFIDKLDNAEE